MPEFADSIKSLTDFSYEYKLSKSIAPWDETYEEVYGSDVEMIDPVTYTFELGDSQWVLEVMPENRWNSNEKLYRLWGYGLLIVLLLTGFVFMIMLLHRTQESENTVVELNKKLQKALEQAKTASVENQHSLVAGMNAHVSKLVEMTVLEKTIRSIKSGGGAPNRRALNSDKWKVTRHKRIEKDS